MTTALDRRPLERGFSLVVVLIAASLLLIVAVGILPLFTRAITNNQQGQQTTSAIHRANSELEDLIQRDFGAAELTIPGGATELLLTEFWDRVNEKWVVDTAWTGSEDPEFQRTIRERQYNLDALRESSKTADWDPLDGGAIPAEVHLKEIEITVRSAGSVGGAAPRSLTLKTLKAF